MDLVFLEKDISAQEFRSIYNFLHSNIFALKPYERIGHQQKIKNFAAMLLTFILKRHIKLLGT
jgi:preprotein translocase subunit SecA